jgi:hypothetical protein
LQLTHFIIAATLSGLSGSVSGTVTGAVALANGVVGNAKLNVAALTIAGNTINKVTTAAIKSISDGATTLVQKDVNTLTTDINLAVSLIKALQLKNTLQAADLTPGKHYIPNWYM